ncbi:MAG: Gfo/Idh/MocA family oxidoreductase [Nitrospiraceae bacterium]
MMRVAVIGLGAVANNIHLPAYRRLMDRMTLVAGCDVDPVARAAMAKSGAFQEIYDDPARMLDRSKPDIVSICTPPALHVRQCLEALERGCHVFCEKPMAESLREADVIIEASARLRRSVVVNSQFPYMHMHMAAKRLIGSPEFGRLLFLHASQTFRPTAQTEAGWRATMQRRLCFEFGVHVFELIRYFFDATPNRLWALMPRPQVGGGTESLNIIAMEFADGRAASILLDRLSKGPERYLDIRLDGEYAAMTTSIGGELRVEAGLHTRQRKLFAGFHLVKGGKAVLQQAERTVVIGKDGVNPMASATAVHFGNFLTALETGRLPAGTAADHRSTLALSLAAYDAVESGRAVEMASYLSRTD